MCRTAPQAGIVRPRYSSAEAEQALEPSGDGCVCVCVSGQRAQRAKLASWRRPPAVRALGSWRVFGEQLWTGLGGEGYPAVLPESQLPSVRLQSLCSLPSVRPSGRTETPPPARWKSGEAV